MAPHAYAKSLIPNTSVSPFANLSVKFPLAHPLTIPFAEMAIISSRLMSHISSL